jgi:F-type H+-transporting ATPase subunit b
MALKHYWKVFSSQTMDAMLHALGEILLRAVPTFLLIILLHFYLKGIFFKPLEKVLRARYEATEGARKLAEQNLAQAAAKTEQFEKTLFAAKSQVYQAQEKAFKALQEQHSAAVAQARAAAEAETKRAKAALAGDVAEVKRTLDFESGALADRIADTILRRNAA